MLADRWADHAARFYRGLRPGHQRQVDAAIAELRTDPYGPGTKALQRELLGKWRRRIGALRLIYSVDHEAEELRIHVLQWRDAAYQGELEAN